MMDATLIPNLTIWKFALTLEFIFLYTFDKCTSKFYNRLRACIETSSAGGHKIQKLSCGNIFY